MIRTNIRVSDFFKMFNTFTNIEGNRLLELLLKLLTKPIEELCSIIVQSAYKLQWNNHPVLIMVSNLYRQRRSMVIKELFHDALYRRHIIRHTIRLQILNLKQHVGIRGCCRNLECTSNLVYALLA